MDLFRRSDGIECSNGHFLCNSDLIPYLTENIFPQLYKLRDNHCGVMCPCDGCNNTYDTVQLFSKMAQRERARYLSIVESISENDTKLYRLTNAFHEVLTLRCPNCKTTVDPFPDACSAVMCLNCGKHYCNYCFAGFNQNESAAAHEHVAQHHPASSPHHRDAFLPNDLVIEGQRQVQRKSLENCLSLVMKSDDYRIQEIACSYVLCASELEDLGFNILHLWNSALHGAPSETSPREMSVAPEAAPPVLQGGVQLANAIKTNNEVAAMQLIQTHGNSLDVNYIDDEYMHPLVTLAVLMDMIPTAMKLLSIGADPLNSSSSGRTVFFVVIELGLLNIVELILSLHPGLDLNQPITSEPHAYYPIHVAAKYNHGHIILRLLSRACDINVQEREFGYTALMMAIVMKEKNYYAAEQLISAGADVTLCGANGRSPLYVSAEVGTVYMMDRMLKKSNFSVNGVLDDVSGMTMLHVAAYHMKMDVLLYLLDCGANPNLQCYEHGYTPLMLAIIAKNVAGAIELINHGANIEIPSKHGRTPFYAAIENGLSELIDHFVVHCKIDVNKPILANGFCDSSSCDHALQIAVMYDQGASIRSLLRHKADVNIVDNLGNTALLTAVICDNEGLLRVLVRAGANTTKPSTQGRSALYIACERGNVSIIHFLITQCGLKVNIPATTESHRIAPIHVAAIFNQPHVIQLLLSLGADPTITDAYHRTAMSLAMTAKATLAIDALMRFAPV